MSGHERDGFRPDVEGLRGVAILLVLAFHAGFSATGGGFVGVDVFFVISGFLITGLLLRERERSGRIDFAAFYARRVRRLLPAGLATLAVVLPAAWLLIGPLDRAAVGLDGAAAALSIGNVRFALQDGGYFATVATPSPFLHYWSLGVEEQFYLVWPALLVVAARGRRPRTRLALALGAVVAVSLGANVVVTDMAGPWAFYSLPTRAWQLGLGGLIAVGTGLLGRVPTRLMALSGWAGAAAVAAAVVGLDPSVPYPGVAALVPTLGAGALIASGGRRHGPGWLLGVPPLRFFGRISYSLYLWHWPVLVLAPLALGLEPTPVALLGLLGLSILVGTASCLLIEEPFRHGRPLAAHPFRTLAVGGSTIALVVALGAGLAEVAVQTIDPPIVGAVTLDDASGAAGVDGAAAGGETGTTDPANVSGRQPSPAGAATPAAATPAAATPAAASSLPSSTTASSAPAPTVPASGSPVAPAVSPTATAPPPTASPPSYRLPADVRPKLSLARGDAERLVRDGCLASEGVTEPRDCVYGDPTGSVVIALVGDSHASDLFPALDAVAKAGGWRLLAFVKVSCPFIDMPLQNLYLKRPYPECAAFRDATARRLAALRPALVVLGFDHFVHPVAKADDTIDVQARAIAHLIDRLPGKVAVLVDHPRSGVDVPGCLSAHRADVRACAVRKEVAFLGATGARERAAATLSGAALIDLTPEMCPALPCPVIIDRTIVFRDNHHLTATFATTLAGPLGARVDEILAPPAVSTPTRVPLRSMVAA